MGRLPTARDDIIIAHLLQVRYHLDAADRQHAAVPIRRAAAHLGPVAVVRHASVRTDRSRTREGRGATHRRFFKTHLPLDAIPIYDGVKMIHVARDGRDAAMSLHNHLANFTPNTWQDLNAISRADPKFGDDYPDHRRTRRGSFRNGSTTVAVKATPAPAFTASRTRTGTSASNEDVLLVHYNDLKTDRAGEMRRVAGFPRDRNTRTALEGPGGCGGFRGHEGTGRRADSSRGSAMGRRRVPIHEQGHQRPLEVGGLGRRSAALRRTGKDRTSRPSLPVGSSTVGSLRATRNRDRGSRLNASAAARRRGRCGRRCRTTS